METYKLLYCKYHIYSNTHPVNFTACYSFPARTIYGVQSLVKRVVGQSDYIFDGDN